MRLISRRRRGLLALVPAVLAALALGGCTFATTFTGTGQIPSATNPGTGIMNPLSAFFLTKALPSGSPLGTSFQFYYRNNGPMTPATLVGNYNDPGSATGNYSLNLKTIVLSVINSFFGGGYLYDGDWGPANFTFNGGESLVGMGGPRSSSPTRCYIGPASDGTQPCSSIGGGPAQACLATKDPKDCAALFSGTETISGGRLVNATNPTNASCIASFFGYTPVDPDVARYGGNGYGLLFACQLLGSSGNNPGLMLLDIPNGIHTGPFAGYANIGITAPGVLRALS